MRSMRSELESLQISDLIRQVRNLEQLTMSQQDQIEGLQGQIDRLVKRLTRKFKALEKSDENDSTV